MTTEESPNLNTYPLINSVQKIALYETKSKYFLVGSNNSQSIFRVLRIDRTEPQDLLVLDDGIEYTEKEVNQMLQSGIKTKNAASVLPKPISAFGIVGFVKFVEGYYLILVTKRRPVATIGLHVIYKIEDTSLIYIPHESYRVANHHEPRYLKMFQNIDLSSNFYFSYSYDITNSYQVNSVVPDLSDVSKNKENQTDTSTKPANSARVHGIRFSPNRKFVWNNYLLSKVEGKISAEWILHIMHGSIGQSNVSVFGRSIYVTLIARRSNKYAGTRFLKRGANIKGDVANEVETEQMVIDLGVSLKNGLRVSSFVQMRGSVPTRWSQDVSKVVAKPAIIFDVSDPFYEIAGKHFNDLFRRYGSPIIILNLVKTREKKKHESQLSEEFSAAVSYLNLFLPPANHIQYISFDMARMNKDKEAKVMDRLAKIAANEISKTGIFLINGPVIKKAIIDKVTPQESLQTGIIRVNCVDCLDRTNTAQFALGKCALAYQLYYLGLIDSPKLEFDSDCVRLLEVLYEDHGDTLALQYGGSQLVHRIKTYRKTAPWTSQGNDIMQTMSRYLRNKFSDAEKQHAINLFLGMFIPEEQKQPIWEQTNDFYLHHPEAADELYLRRFPLTQWWDENILNCLPLSYNYQNRECLMAQPNISRFSEYVDLYLHYHRTDKISALSSCYTFGISHSIRDFMPQCVTDFSPFTVRIRPGRMMEEMSKSGKNECMKNPSVTGKSSSSSNTSSSDEYDSEEDEDSHNTLTQRSFENVHQIKEKEKKPTNAYGIGELRVDEHSRMLYEKYAKIEKLSQNAKLDENLNDCIETNVHAFAFSTPVISEESTNVYQKYVEKLSYELVPNYVISKYENYMNNELDIFIPIVI